MTKCYIPLIFNGKCPKYFKRSYENIEVGQDSRFSSVTLNKRQFFGQRDGAVEWVGKVYKVCGLYRLLSDDSAFSPLRPTHLTGHGSFYVGFYGFETSIVVKKSQDLIKAVLK